MTKITLAHARAHNDHLGYENHTIPCLRDFHARYGLDWERFLREGLDRAEVEATVGPDDPALNALLAFMDSEHAPVIEDAPTADDVKRERESRELAGSTFTPAGYGAPIRLAGDDRTARNLMARAGNARDAIAAGETGAVFAWRDENNVVHNLTPAQLLDLFRQASMYVDAVSRASWALIDNPPIPEDYAADERWPERSL